MNIILFRESETERALPRDDARARHVLEVLRLTPGDSFDAGIIDGPLGKATLVSLDDASLTLSFAFEDELPPPLAPITLVVGLSRPLTARRVLQDAATLGVQALHFVTTQRGEASYAKAGLWRSGEWQQALINGTQQAFDTRLPAVTRGRTLAETLASLPAGGCRLALDNYEATASLADVALTTPVVLALGSERGWSARERDALRGAGFQVVHLGSRVLRLETACVAAISIVKARLGLL